MVRYRKGKEKGEGKIKEEKKKEGGRKKWLEAGKARKRKEGK